jgi:two-component sensor histidine kinase/PAS domain-containing protein
MALTDWLFGGPGAAPYGASLSWRPSLIAFHVASDVIAALAFIAIPIGIAWFARRRQDLLHKQRVLAWWFGGLLLAASATEIIDILTIWYPMFGLQALAKAGTAVAAVAAFAVMWPQLPDLVRLPTSLQLADVNRRLRREAAAHESTLRELEGAHRELESRVAERTKELSQVTARFETALRGAQVYLYSQDRDLATTWSYSPRGDDVLPSPDSEQVVPQESQGAIVAMRREALDSGLSQDGEVSINDGATVRWFDLHIEPQRDVSGVIVGLTCAAVDITERKEGEAHLRLLMRELTHRSKNLLAVIQAMARQTARRVGTIDGFLEQFSARLQALARSHDLLVQEGWHGVALGELARSQLGHHLDRGGNAQISVEGPPVLLRPEAAQSLGLALHELATNAAKYGALSAESGRISIRWALLGNANPPNLEINWLETGGPAVTPPEHRGFGSLVIERNLTGSLDAQVELTFPPEGVRCRIFIPGAQLYGP